MSAIVTTYHLEIIKNLCLEKAGIKSIMPSDCRIISFLIMKDTGLNISETTLKRLFGLAISKFSPSIFTINTLAVYCGFEGWESFCHVNPIKKLPDAGHPTGWYQLQSRAREASDFTLQALRNKSGIPYRQTIAREFMDDHFRAFDESGLTGSVITAPAGYGKTIALCHWLEKQSESSNDVVLFYSSVALMSVLHGGKSIDDWMAFLLGFHTRAAFSELIDGRGNAKFYLVLDGMDDHMFKKEQFHLLLNQLSYLYAFYRQFDWFKLVLTMRSTTWINYKHELELGENRWFTSCGENEECINAPLFSYREVQLLNDRISAPSVKQLSPEQAGSFSHPVYFQYYYQMQKGTFPASGAKRISSYELSSLFMLNKVYVGYYAAEKVSLLQQLADMLDFGDEHYQVEKLKVMNILNKNDQAFRELLSAGVLRQLNISTGHKFAHHIRFGNPDFVFHTIARSMLNDNGDRFDGKLVDLINTRFGKHKAKIHVLKWCLMLALKTGQRTGFQYLSGADLNLNEKSDLILFLGDLLEKVGVSMKKEESFWQFFNEDAGDRLFDFFFGLELINEDYKTTLNTLLKFELNSYKKIIVYTTLGIIAVINLNIKELEKQIIRLKNMESYNSAGFSFNPLNCLELIFNYLKHGTIRSDLMRGLTKNAFLLQVPTQHGNAASDLVFLLGIYTCCGFLPGIRSKGLLRRLSLLSSAEKVQNALSAFDFFKRMITADIHFRNGEHAAVSAIFTEVHTSYGLQHDLLTPYMETLLLSLKIKMMLTSGTSDLIPFEIKGIHAVTEVSGSKLTKLYLDSLLIRHEQLMSRHLDLKRELAYDIMKVISKQELNQNLVFFEQDLSRFL